MYGKEQTDTDLRALASMEETDTTHRQNKYTSLPGYVGHKMQNIYPLPPGHRLQTVQ